MHVTCSDKQSDRRAPNTQTIQSFCGALVRRQVSGVEKRSNRSKYGANQRQKLNRGNDTNRTVAGERRSQGVEEHAA